MQPTKTQATQCIGTSTQIVCCLHSFSIVEEKGSDKMIKMSHTEWEKYTMEIKAP